MPTLQHRFGRPGNYGKQFIRIDRFAYKGCHSQFNRPEQIGRLGKGRAEQDRGVGRALFQPGRQLQAVHVWHADVADDQVGGPSRLECCKGRAAIVGLQDPVAVQSQKGRGLLPEIVFILDQQDVKAFQVGHGSPPAEAQSGMSLRTYSAASSVVRRNCL